MLLIEKRKAIAFMMKWKFFKHWWKESSWFVCGMTVVMTFFYIWCLMIGVSMIVDGLWSSSAKVGVEWSTVGGGIFSIVWAFLPYYAYRHADTHHRQWATNLKQIVVQSTGSPYAIWQAKQEMSDRLESFEQDKNIELLTLSDIHFGAVFYEENPFWHKVKILLLQNDEEHTLLSIESGCPDITNIEHVHSVLKEWLRGDASLTKDMTEVILYQ